jgi:hypothetical protein
MYEIYGKNLGLRLINDISMSCSYKLTGDNINIMCTKTLTMPVSMVKLPCSGKGCRRNDIALSRNLFISSVVQVRLSVSLISHHP